jgi:hypothetical protein
MSGAIVPLMKGSFDKRSAFDRALVEAARADLTPVYRLAYVSKATPLMKSEDLRAIAEVSGPRNASADITGILVMDGGRILQVLEGQRQAVVDLFERISGDPRHEEVRQVSGGEQDARLLNNWSMVSGDGGVVPSDLLRAFHSLYRRLEEVNGLVEVSPDEVELLKTISLFRSIPSF